VVNDFIGCNDGEGLNFVLLVDGRIHVSRILEGERITS
jgi:hypothetical protein